MLFRLARDLGMTVRELELRMESPELTEWKAFYRIEWEIQTGNEPPLEFDDAEQQSAAIDALFR